MLSKKVFKYEFFFFSLINIKKFKPFNSKIFKISIILKIKLIKKKLKWYILLKIKKSIKK